MLNKVKFHHLVYFREYRSSFSSSLYGAINCSFQVIAHGNKLGILRLFITLNFQEIFKFYCSQSVNNSFSGHHLSYLATILSIKKSAIFLKGILDNYFIKFYIILLFQCLSMIIQRTCVKF